MVLGKAGAAIVIEQKNITNQDMIAHIEKLYQNPEKLRSMAKQAASLAIPDTEERIWKVIQNLISEKK